MIYLFISVVFITIIVLALYFYNKAQARKALMRIRLEWGKPKIDEFMFDSIVKYLLVSKDKSFHQLTDQTIKDLDFYRVFEFVDRTSSKIGQQFLFKKMVQPANSVDAKIEEYAALFFDNPRLREDVQVQLIKLNNNDAYHIVSLLQDKLIPKPRWLKWAYISLFILIVLLFLSVKYPVCWIFAIIPASINMFVHYWNKNNSFQFSKSLPQLNVLIEVVKVLVKKDVLFSNTLVSEAIAGFISFNQKVRLLSFFSNGGLRDELSQVGTYFVTLIKAFFLVEIITLFRLIDELKLKRSFIETLFRYVGEIDVAISIASLRSGELKTCKPEFSVDFKQLSAMNLYHPLINDCTKNNLTIINKGVLITGSNMSGKTTFLRTVAINSILAQSMNTCFADEFKSPVLRQFSSIRIQDDLFEGASYYLQEVSIIGSLIEASNSTSQNLFLLDEVFKGTNTHERIAAAKAILSYLNSGKNIVIVSTHDIELATMLEIEYDLFHFTETIENDRLLFDHKIKAGPLKTRNAIKILQLAGYPKEIIDEAKTLSSDSSTKENAQLEIEPT
ncbi:MutS family DNA mismatch repair protein [soil metagenome]